MKGSITNANTRASQMADILQQARMTITEENDSLALSQDDTRRIILICILYIVLDNQLNNETILFTEVLDKLNISALYEKWFSFRNDGIKVNLSKTIKWLLQLKKFDDWNDLLDYSCESLEYDTDVYFSVSIKRGVRSDNSIKKDHGIYYTPEDTVSFMVTKCLKYLSEKKELDSCSYLDCSCGTSVFLKTLFCQLEAKCNTLQNINKSLAILDKCIWGIDKSDKAIDNSIFVFLKYYLIKYPDAQNMMNTIISTIWNSFCVGDATKLDDVLSRNTSFPSQYNCIIGNPPYVTINRNTNLFIRFVEIMIEYSADESYSALVLPLSICYSQGSDYVALRKQIMNDNASWEFHNYDRSPDSLFGDQVKTRNTIVFRNSINDAKRTYVTKLQRWTAETRQSIFSDFNLCNISSINIQKRIPKLSFEYELVPYLNFSTGNTSISTLKSKARTDDYIVLNGTAYNWICAYDHFPPSKDESGQLYRSNASSILYFPDTITKYFCLAMLSNRFSYWFWTVIGDGFHVNATFASEYHFNKSAFTNEQFLCLSNLGREYCESIKKYPTISYNSGKMLVNYSHWESMQIVENIESIIRSALSLPSEFCSNLAKWYLQQVTCNR